MVSTTKCVMNSDGPDKPWFDLHKCAKGNLHININLHKSFEHIRRHTTSFSFGKTHEFKCQNSFTLSLTLSGSLS